MASLDIQTVPDFIIKINGIPISSVNYDASIKINTSLSSQANSFEIAIRNLDKEMLVLFQINNYIEIYFKIGNTLILNVFSGKIKRIELKYLEDGGSNLLIFGIEKSHDRLQKKIISKTYKNRMATDIIRDIALQSNVKVGYIEPSSILLENWMIDRQAGYRAINDLCKRINYIWHIRNELLYASSKTLFGLSHVSASILAGMADIMPLINETHVDIDSTTIHKYTNYYKIRLDAIPFLSSGDQISLNINNIIGKYLVISCNHSYKWDGTFLTEALVILPTSTNTEIMDLQDMDILDLTQNLIELHADESHSIHVGDVSTINDEDHSISFTTGQKVKENPSIITPSTELLTSFNVTLPNKQVASILATDNGGLIMPLYDDQRFVLLKNLDQKDDVIPLGNIWTKSMSFPKHQSKDFLLSLPIYTGLVRKSQNYAFLVNKEGLETRNMVGLDLNIGSSQLLPASTRPTNATTGELNINFDGSPAVNGIARKEDQTIVDATTDAALFTWWTSFWAAFTTFLTGLNPTTLAGQAATFLAWISANAPKTSYTGKINQASTNAKCG